MENNQDQREVEGQYYIMNGIQGSTLEIQEKTIPKSPSVYEVIRVMAEVPLFLQEHLDRLNQSLQLLDHSFRIDTNILKKQIHDLIRINQNPQQNIKIIINDLNTQSPNVYLFFIPSNYPCPVQYEKGVSTILMEALRENPNIKAVAHNQRERINAAIKAANVYEAILVNENKEVTEGSRSNIFVVKSNILYTAPAQEVLMGITRARVIKLCEQLNITVVEKGISTDFLFQAEGLFLTGTSPKVLPIELVDQRKYASSQHPIILELRHAYDELINEYIGDSIQ